MSSTISIEELNKLNDNDIDDSVEMISKIFGGGNDSDITETYRTIIETLINQLKASPDGEVGLKDIFEITNSVVSSINYSIDSEKIKKTVTTVNSTFDQNLIIKDLASSFVSAKDDLDNISEMDNIMARAKSLMSTVDQKKTC